jgi:hypothetical protein
MLNGTRNKATNNSLLNQSYKSSSQNSFNKSLNGRNDNSFTGEKKPKREIKLTSLNEKLYLINEFKKGNLKKDIATSIRSDFKETLGNIANKGIARQNLRTKLIPREKFMNSSSLASTEFKVINNTTKGNDVVSNNNTENGCLDNDLELLDHRSFESSLLHGVGHNYMGPTGMGDPKIGRSNTMYNSDILNLLTKKHMSVSSSPKNRFNIKMGGLYVTDLGDGAHQGYKTNISYSKNVSRPKPGTSTSYADFSHKMNTSNITLESEKSFNNNILFTDGGITNINIHGILGCDEIPNEIYFNDRRYKAIQESLNNTLQENSKQSHMIKELTATVDILKCYIKMQEVRFS